MQVNSTEQANMTVQTEANQCPKCGASLAPDAAFCGICGSKLEPVVSISYPEESAEMPVMNTPQTAVNNPQTSVNTPQPVAGSYQTETDSSQDKPSMGFNILGFLIPLVGLVLYLVWKNEYPLKAKSVGNAALFGVLFNVVVRIITTSI